MQKQHRVTDYSSAMTRFVVYKTESTKHIFKPSKKGLLFSDFKQEVSHVLVNTVGSIKENTNK